MFTAAHGLSLVAVSRGYSSLWCAGFSLQWLLLLPSTGSRRRGFNSCGARVQSTGSVVTAHGLSFSLECGIFLDWGSNPNPALAGGFLTSGPLGKPLSSTLISSQWRGIPCSWADKRENGLFLGPLDPKAAVIVLKKPPKETDKIELRSLGNCRFLYIIHSV